MCKASSFIRKAKKKHGNRYDYSKVDYTGYNNEVLIICSVHGEFSQAPYKHLRTMGCGECSNLSRRTTQAKTTDEFIKDAIDTHGDAYDYSKVDYKNAYTKITIICPIHGEFQQSPDCHTQGRGCQDCGKSKPKDTDKFIIAAKNVHSDEYDYSKVDYVNSRTAVIIICKFHNEFLQTPDHHLQGSGCYECGIILSHLARTKTTDQFIIDAKRIHGERYDYSKVNYINCKTCVIIICSIHGEFQQNPSDHLGKHGCGKCGIESTANSKTSTKDQFIINAKKIHDNKYDYTKVIYENSQKHVIITCSSHGDFLQIPGSHLQGRGCASCGNESTAALLSKTTEQFIIDAKKEHGNEYNYSKVDYKNAYTKIIIICSQHGEFQQSPTSHLGGSGCPYCINKTETIVYEYLDSIGVQHERQFSPSWLLNVKTGCKYRFDLVIPKYKLIIEIDGPQHFKQTWIWHSPETQRSTDIEKMFLALENDYSILRLSQEDVLEKTFYWKEFILKNLIERPEPDIVYQNNIIYSEHETLFYEMAGDRYTVF